MSSAPKRTSEPLPSIQTPFTAEQVREKLLFASKRGRMAGFEESPAEGLFTVAAHGQPFDGQLVGELSGGRLSFQVRMLRKLPVIFAVVLVLTVYPGEYFMDQLIPGQWGWINTWWWYGPLTVLPLPWMWRSLMRKSWASIDASAKEAIEKIASEVEGKVVPSAESQVPSVAQPTPR